MATLIVLELVVAALVATLALWSVRRRRPVDTMDWLGLVVMSLCLFALLSGIVLVLTGQLSFLDQRWMTAQLVLLIISVAAFQLRRVRRRGRQ